MTPEQIYTEAYNAGMRALGNCTPEPMTVVGGGKSYYIPDGMCGFAWVVIKPARGKFVNFLKARGLGHSGYGGGYHYWISEGNQSMAKKEAFGRAFAEVLNQNGIKAYMNSRLD